LAERAKTNSKLQVILIEDTHGKGHLSQAVNGQFRHSILIPVD
jgi:hypothetical protein